MPKHPYLFIEKDRCWTYRKRIPTDLVRAGCYGKSKEIKRSLETSDLATAKRRAQAVAIQVQAEFDAKRREVLLGSQIAKCASAEDAPANRSLSESERRDFIIRAFIANEKLESAVRSFESDPEIRELKLAVTREDLGAVCGSSHYMDDWISRARQALAREGISIDATRDAAILRSIADMLRRGATVSALRTERAINGTPFGLIDPFFDTLHQDSPLPQAAKKTKTIGDLLQSYKADADEREKAGNLRPSTIKWKGQSAKVVADFFDNSSVLTSITRDDAFRLVAFLPTIPSNASKRFKNVSIVKAAELEAKQGRRKLISAKTVRHYFEGVSNIFKFAVTEEWIDENPLDKQSVRERLPKVVEIEKRPLTPDEMTTVLSSPEFVSQRTGGRGSQEIRYWLPLLCLFEGTRANEVAAILVADIKESDGVHYLNLRNTDEQRLKTSSSVRKVPLHSKMVELGFLDFVAKRRASDPEGYLFPGVTRNKNGSMSDPVGKWWAGIVIRLLGPPQADWPTGSRGIHSLRHSWIAAARTAEIQEDLWERITGHSSGKKVSRRYGRHGELPTLKTAIDKIQFPKVDFSALWPSGKGQ